MSNFESNWNTFSILCSIDYFRFGPGIAWYRYQVIGNRPSLVSLALGTVASLGWSTTLRKMQLLVSVVIILLQTQQIQLLLQLSQLLHGYRNWANALDKRKEVHTNSYSNWNNCQKVQEGSEKNIILPWQKSPDRKEVALENREYLR